MGRARWHKRAREQPDPIRTRNATGRAATQNSGAASGCLRAVSCRGVLSSKRPHHTPHPSHLKAHQQVASAGTLRIRRATAASKLAYFWGQKLVSPAPERFDRPPCSSFLFFRNDTPPNEWHRGAAAHQLTTDQVVSLANNFLPALPSSRLSVCPRRPTT